jgi:hypothetical protein
MRSKAGAVELPCGVVQSHSVNQTCASLRAVVDGAVVDCAKASDILGSLRQGVDIQQLTCILYSSPQHVLHFCMGPGDNMRCLCERPGCKSVKAGGIIKVLAYGKAGQYGKIKCRLYAMHALT